MRFSRPEFLRSLRVQLMIGYLVGLMLVPLLVALVFAAVNFWRGDAIANRGLRDVATDVASRLEYDASGRPIRLAIPTRWQWIYNDLPQDFGFRVIDRDGHSIEVDKLQDELLPSTVRVDPTDEISTLRIEGKRVHVVSMPLERGPESYFLQVAASGRVVDLAGLVAWRTLPGGVVPTLILSTLILAGLMLFAVARFLRPIRNASNAASQIEARNLSFRLSVSNIPTELLPLIEAFNLALGRLQHGFETQQQFLGSAAHELKTPLSLLRGQVELEGTLDRDTLLADIDVMVRQVQQLLHLAEVSEIHNFKIEPIPVAEVANEVIAFLARIAERDCVTLDLHLPAEQVIWHGDRSALFTLIKNLMENAIQHSPKSGVVTLAVGRGSLSVRDEGHGILVQDMPHLFERYWRARPLMGEGGGAGLGLAICREIALAHRWRLFACEVSSGATFRLSIDGIADARSIAK